MKKKLLIISAVFLILTATVLILNSTHVLIGGTLYPRNATHIAVSGSPKVQPDVFTQLEQLSSLDLRALSLTPEEYEAFSEALPNCQILWSVPFQENYYSSDITDLTVSSLTDADISLLKYFTNLATLHAGGCRDYEQLSAVQAACPDLEILYTVAIGGNEYSPGTSHLTLSDVSADELSSLLQYLPKLETVRLEGILPEAAQLISLTEAYSSIQFYWQVELFGITVDSHTTELDLSGIPMDSVAPLEAAVAYLPALEKVYMMDCGIPDEEMGALNRRNDSVLFVWNVNIGPITVRTDITAFAPVKYGYELWDSELENLKYCTELVVLDLGHMRLWEIDFLSGLTKLEYLIIADTHVQDISPLKNLKNLKFLEMFMTDVRDYSPLLELTALEDLNINFTPGDPTPLMQMTWLKRLWCGGCLITNEQLSQLHSALPNTQIATPFTGSTDQGWRTGEHYFIMRDLLGMPYFD